jgi:hypothetical protein
LSVDRTRASAAHGRSAIMSRIGQCGNSGPSVGYPISYPIIPENRTDGPAVWSEFPIQRSQTRGFIIGYYRVLSGMKSDIGA